MNYKRSRRIAMEAQKKGRERNRVARKRDELRAKKPVGKDPNLT